MRKAIEEVQAVNTSATTIKNSAEKILTGTAVPRAARRAAAHPGAPSRAPERKRERRSQRHAHTERGDRGCKAELLLDRPDERGPEGAAEVGQ